LELSLLSSKTISKRNQLLVSDTERLETFNIYKLENQFTLKLMILEVSQTLKIFNYCTFFTKNIGKIQYRDRLLNRSFILLE